MGRYEGVLGPGYTWFDPWRDWPLPPGHAEAAAAVETWIASGQRLIGQSKKPPKHVWPANPRRAGLVVYGISDPKI